MEEFLKKVLDLILNNWKTFAIGLASVIVWVLANGFAIQLDPMQIAYIQTVLVGLAVFFHIKDKK